MCEKLHVSTAALKELIKLHFVLDDELLVLIVNGLLERHRHTIVLESLLQQ